jgi:hypothetical protein
VADAKYGRLFTFRDVVRLINAMTHESPDERLNLAAVEAQAVRDADGEPLTFPADEPLFLLRGQDRVAWASVEHYAVHCDVQRVDPDHASAAHDAADTFHEWQAEHPDRVKVPD